MKFSIGDPVLLKRTGEEGIVTAIESRELIEVRVNGTTFPVHIDELDHPYLAWFTKKGSVVKKTPATTPIPKPEQAPTMKERPARGAYLSFLPVFQTIDMEDRVVHVKVYLLNELPVTVRYTYDVRLNDQSLFSHEGLLHPFGNVYLHTIEYIDLSAQPRFNWSLIDTTFKNNAREEGVLRIKPTKLFGHISTILQGGEPSFAYELVSAFKERREPEPPPPVPMPGKQLNTAPLSNKIEVPKGEIDLHIEALMPNHKGMSNAEIIKVQLDALHKYVQQAIVHRLQRLIVIHGLGKGRLREEVHAALKTIPEVARFKNEWSGKYGFGATEVTLKY